MNRPCFTTLRQHLRQHLKAPHRAITYRLGSWQDAQERATERRLCIKHTYRAVNTPRLVVFPDPLSRTHTRRRACTHTRTRVQALAEVAHVPEHTIRTNRNRHTHTHTYTSYPTDTWPSRHPPRENTASIAFREYDTKSCS